MTAEQHNQLFRAEQAISILSEWLDKAQMPKDAELINILQKKGGYPAE